MASPSVSTTASRLVIPPEEFFSEISQFHVKDFALSSNEEFLLLKSLIDYNHSMTGNNNYNDSEGITGQSQPPLSLGMVVYPPPLQFISVAEEGGNESTTGDAHPFFDPVVFGSTTSSKRFDPSETGTPMGDHTPLMFSGSLLVSNGHPLDNPPTSALAATNRNRHRIQRPIPCSSPAAKKRLLHQSPSDPSVPALRRSTRTSVSPRPKRVQTLNSTKVNGKEKEFVEQALLISSEDLGFICSNEENEGDGAAHSLASQRKPNYHSLTMRGENRLKITFSDFGDIGRIPQRFGKHGCWIPNGLRGSNQVYEQNWSFQVSHFPSASSGIICISWKITNMTSGTVVHVVETEQEAAQRETSGRTICNVVLKQAFELRARELEATLPHLENNTSKMTNVQNLIKALKPKRCTVGLLFFGLLHESVQQRMEDIIARRGL